MRIYKKTTDQVAERDRDGKFVCGLKKPDNSLSKYEYFEKIEDAGNWVCAHPEWGIRMNPNWSLIHRDIVIDRDA